MCSFLCDHLATPPNHSCAWFCIGLNLATHAMLKKQTNQTIIFMSERTHIPRRPCFHQSLLCPYPFLCTHHASTHPPLCLILLVWNRQTNAKIIITCQSLPTSLDILVFILMIETDKIVIKIMIKSHLFSLTNRLHRSHYHSPISGLQVDWNVERMIILIVTEHLFCRTQTIYYVSMIYCFPLYQMTFWQRVMTIKIFPLQMFFMVIFMTMMVIFPPDSWRYWWLFDTCV